MAHSTALCFWHQFWISALILLVINVDSLTSNCSPSKIKWSAVKFYSLIVFLEYDGHACGPVHFKVLYIQKALQPHCPKQDFQILEIIIHLICFYEVHWQQLGKFRK